MTHHLEPLIEQRAEEDLVLLAIDRYCAETGAALAKADYLIGNQLNSGQLDFSMGLTPEAID